jgi:predicted anti-sigma-YlaC factor YlaD
MNCNQVQSRLSSYLDSELSGREMVAVRSHLDSCEACRAEETAERHLKELLSDLCVREPSADFEQRLLANVMTAHESRTHHRWRPAFALVGVGAFAMVVTLTLTSWLRLESSLVAESPESRTIISRDQAFVAGDDPLSDSSMVVPATYAGR